MRTRSFPAASESPAVLREVLAPERVSPPARSQSTYSVCGVIECVWLPCTLPGASVHAQANVLKYYSILFYFLSSLPPPPPPLSLFQEGVIVSHPAVLRNHTVMERTAQRYSSTTARLLGTRRRKARNCSTRTST